MARNSSSLSSSIVNAGEIQAIDFMWFCGFSFVRDPERDREFFGIAYLSSWLFSKNHRCSRRSSGAPQWLADRKTNFVVICFLTSSDVSYYRRILPTVTDTFGHFSSWVHVNSLELSWDRIAIEFSSTWVVIDLNFLSTWIFYRFELRSTWVAIESQFLTVCLLKIATR